MEGDPNTAKQSIVSLSHDSKYLLSCLLNPKKVFLNENRILRDWRGLAQVVKLSREEITYIKIHNDCTSKVLELWLTRSKETAVVGYLFDCLKRIDRYDIYDDLYKLYKTGYLLSFDQQKTAITKVPSTEEVLTYDDKLYGIQTYNAFLLYANEDEDFVVKLKYQMQTISSREGTQIRICTREDLLPGHCTQYVPVSKLIMERCQHIIVVFTPHFFKDSANQFFINYSQAVSIDKDYNQCMIIPVVVGDYEPPDNNFKYYFKLEYKPSRQLSYEFWEKLFITISESPKSQRVLSPAPYVPTSYKNSFNSRAAEIQQKDHLHSWQRHVAKINAKPLEAEPYTKSSIVNKNNESINKSRTVLDNCVNYDSNISSIKNSLPVSNISLTYDTTDRESEYLISAKELNNFTPEPKRSADVQQGSSSGLFSSIRNQFRDVFRKKKVDNDKRKVLFAET